MQALITNDMIDENRLREEEKKMEKKNREIKTQFMTRHGGHQIYAQVIIHI